MRWHLTDNSFPYGSNARRSIALLPQRQPPFVKFILPYTGETVGRCKRNSVRELHANETIPLEGSNFAYNLTCKSSHTHQQMPALQFELSRRCLAHSLYPIVLSRVRGRQAAICAFCCQVCLVKCHDRQLASCRGIAKLFNRFPFRCPRCRKFVVEFDRSSLALAIVFVASARI